ncbi:MULTISPECIES: hypothetical protein [Pseudomonas]|uniref:hypothetical protein n=1 Tax=Pseudomonas TaxID=286 RepID=UPI00190DF0FC|nr:MULTISPECIES: hypothetical protein [Pseudomonas]MBK3477656.1 hypothetical protein [Pseudomonas sp. MF6751]MBO0495735.1 hypothetical protein [Pseudomonas sp. Marseille-Q1929]MBW9247321.1 hypothetical protein [Pseudomonas paracarnis]
MSTTDKPDSHIIELSSVYFYSGPAPRAIALKDCGVPTDAPISGAFPALYGYQSKQDGFMAARAYADKNRLQFTVVDFLVELDQKQNPNMMRPDDIPNHDFISFARMSRSMMDDLQAVLHERLAKEGITPSKLELAKPHLLLQQRPDLVSSLIEAPGWDHMKVIAYPAKLTISEKPLTVGIVPHSHWDSIKEASCRLNPGIRITLEPPNPSQVDSATSAVASPSLKDRGPRSR